MKSLLLIFLSGSLWLIATESCKKKNPGTITSGGGKGGNATICVTPQHHYSLLDSCTIYIKYGTLDAPENGVYDDSQRCTMQGPADTTPTACFPGLTNGIYYVFAKGYHPGYGDVIGGESWTVSVQDSQLSYPIQPARYCLQTSTY